MGEQNNNTDKIDFVLIWVDGNDEEWQKEKLKYSGNTDAALSTVNRYRDWENLKYWFRGVEKFAPWVNNVYFITCGHYPEWLNLDAPKLKFIKHKDYIPEEYLPTFSSHPIELNLHRIESLSDKFVYFNDDTFIINHIKKEDFFDKDKPRYVAGCNCLYGNEYDDIFAHILLNNASIINSKFNKNKVIMGNLLKWFNLKYGFRNLLKTVLLLAFEKFPAFTELHLPCPMLKSTMDEVWNNEFDILNQTSKNKFRTSRDVNQYLFKWFDIARGNFESASILGQYYELRNAKEKCLNAIEKQKHKMICFSDDLEIDFEKTKEEIINAFEKILPDKSSFEK